MTDDREEGPPTLDYGVEEPHRLRPRDSTEYYREPPALADATLLDFAICAAAALVVCVLAVWLVLRSWHWSAP